MYILFIVYWSAYLLPLPSCCARSPPVLFPPPTSQMNLLCKLSWPPSPPFSPCPPFPPCAPLPHLHPLTRTCRDRTPIRSGRQDTCQRGAPLPRRRARVRCRRVPRGEFRETMEECCESRGRGGGSGGKGSPRSCANSCCSLCLRGSDNDSLERSLVCLSVSNGRLQRPPTRLRPSASENRKGPPLAPCGPRALAAAPGAAPCAP